MFDTLNSPHQFNRRKMLATSAAIATAVALPGQLLARDDNAQSDACLLGFSTYGMKSVPTEKALQTLGEIGFDAVELAVRSGWDADSAKLSTARRKTIRKMLADGPLRLTSLMEHVPPTSAKNQAVALERLKLATEVAHALAPFGKHPPILQTVLGGGDFADVKTQLRDRLGDWVKLANETETTIAIKPHRGGACSQPANAAWLLEQLGHPQRLKMVYDYSHYAFRDLSIADTIATALPHTVHIAVKDAAQDAKRVVFQLPGEAGTIDFAEILRRFYAGGYRGDFNCEVSGMVSGKPGYDPIAAAKTCYQNMSRAFQAANVPRPR